MLDKTRVEKIIKAALKEDIGQLDVTTSALIPKPQDAKASIVFNEGGIICGLPVCEMVFELLDRRIHFKPQLTDGDSVEPGKVVAYLDGPARPILTGERIALNFLSILSGIATKTNKFVQAVSGLPVVIMDTRKTMPNLRYLERYAVRIGGGVNHRMGLWDQALIKDNHVALVGAVKEAVELAKKHLQKNIKVEVEVNNLEEFKEAVKAKPDIIMLDNMALDDVRAAVKMRASAKLEASGGITLDNVRAYAEAGVDMVSVGELTDSVHALDVSLQII